MRARGASWYACRDAGGQWPQMYGPYNEGRARLEASTLAGGFVVGFEGGADRRDFLRAWEGARTSEARERIASALRSVGVTA